jgi:hypothetical protein
MATPTASDEAEHQETVWAFGVVRTRSRSFERAAALLCAIGYDNVITAFALQAHTAAVTAEGVLRDTAPHPSSTVARLSHEPLSLGA